MFMYIHRKDIII